MSDFKKRIAVSSILTPILACLIAFAHNIWFQYVVVAAVGFATAIAVWEFAKLAQSKEGNIIGLRTLRFFSVLLAISFFWNDRISGLTVMILFLGLLVLFADHFKRNKGAVIDLSVSCFGLLYIAVPMGMMLGILYMPGVDGRWWIAYLLVVTKITDIGAYFAGSLLGRHKLAPKISPGKTIEGGIFGLCCAVGASAAFSSILNLGMAKAIVLGLILGIIGQFGDLAESLLKRDANKKDSNVLPGIGGALDAIDSLLFNIPILYIYLNYV